MLLCKAEREEILSLKEIKNDIILNNINIKYNFIIKPVNINEKITVINSYNEAHIFGIYPYILDFTSKDSFYIDLFVIGDSTNFKFSFNGKEDLYCEKLKLTQRCIVPKQHFEGKNNGTYYITFYKENINKIYISYLTNPVSVILPTKYDYYISSNLNNEVGKKGSVIFDLYDNFFSDDINRAFIFKKNILDEKNKSHEIECRFWKNDRGSYIYCEFNENFPKGQYYFQFNDTFNYLGYEINLYSYEIFNITKLDSDLIDLYSETQTINVIDDKDIYELKFKIVSYNEENIFITYIFHEPLNCS